MLHEANRVKEYDLTGPKGERITIREGDRIELDNVAGIVCGETSTGTVIGMTCYPSGELSILAIELDPNQKLRELHEQFSQQMPKIPDALRLIGFEPQKSGLDGTGGPIYLTSDGVHWNTASGALRVVKPAEETPAVPSP